MKMCWTFKLALVDNGNKKHLPGKIFTLYICDKYTSNFVRLFQFDQKCDLGTIRSITFQFQSFVLIVLFIILGKMACKLIS